MSNFQTSLDRAMDRYRAMSPEDQAEMWRKQKESYVRAMTKPCEHGFLDFETCPECLTKAGE